MEYSCTCMDTCYHANTRPNHGCMYYSNLRLHLTLLAEQTSTVSCVAFKRFLARAMQCVAGVLEIDREGAILRSQEHAFYPAGLLFGVPSASMQTQPLSRYMDLAGKTVSELLYLPTAELVNDGKKGNLKVQKQSKSGKGKISPLHRLLGMHTDGEPLQLSVQLVPKESGQSRLHMIIHASAPARGSDAFLERLKSLAQPLIEGIAASSEQAAAQGSDNDAIDAHTAQAAAIAAAGAAAGGASSRVTMLSPLVAGQAVEGRGNLPVSPRGEDEQWLVRDRFASRHLDEVEMAHLNHTHGRLKPLDELELAHQGNSHVPLLQHQGNESMATPLSKHRSIVSMLPAVAPHSLSVSQSQERAQAGKEGSRQRRSSLELLRKSSNLSALEGTHHSEKAHTEPLQHAVSGVDLDMTPDAMLGLSPRVPAMPRAATPPHEPAPIPPVIVERIRSGRSDPRSPKGLSGSLHVPQDILIIDAAYLPSADELVLGFQLGHGSSPETLSPAAAKAAGQVVPALNLPGSTANAVSGQEVGNSSADSLGPNAAPAPLTPPGTLAATSPSRAKRVSARRNRPVGLSNLTINRELALERVQEGQEQERLLAASAAATEAATAAAASADANEVGKSLAIGKRGRDAVEVSEEAAPADVDPEPAMPRSEAQLLLESTDIEGPSLGVLREASPARPAQDISPAPPVFEPPATFSLRKHSTEGVPAPASHTSAQSGEGTSIASHDASADDGHSSVVTPEVSPRGSAVDVPRARRASSGGMPEHVHSASGSPTHRMSSSGPAAANMTARSQSTEQLAFGGLHAGPPSLFNGAAHVPQSTRTRRVSVEQGKPLQPSLAMQMARESSGGLSETAGPQRKCSGGADVGGLSVPAKSPLARVRSQPISPFSVLNSECFSHKCHV